MPGLADTRGLEQDELHRKSIAAQIKAHVDTISAVLVLTNGTRVTAGTNYALSTLSAIFPETLMNNVAFMSTNVSSRSHCNFSKETIPDALRDAPHFLLNNPIALQRKYLKLMDDPRMKKSRTDFRKVVKTTEQETLEVFVDFFDWLDGRKPLSTADIVPRYQDTSIPTNQGAAKKAMGLAVSYSHGLRTALESYPHPGLHVGGGKKR